MKRSLRSKSAFNTNILAAALASVGRPSIENETVATPTADAGGSAPAPTKAARKPKPAKKAKMPKTSKKLAKKAKKAKSAATGKMADILHAAAKDYARPKGKDGKPLKTAAGNPIVDSGDKVAVMLRGKDIEDIYSLVSKKIDVPAAELKRKYGKLNPGQQRMNLGNRLRAAIK